MRADVSKPEQAQALIDAATRRFGRVDVLLNHAAVIHVGPVESVTPELMAPVLTTNFWGAVHTTYAVLPQMRARRAGRIVNLHLIGGLASLPHLLPYRCAKFALHRLPLGLRAERAKFGIRVTNVAPGLVRTGTQVNTLYYEVRGFRSRSGASPQSDKLALLGQSGFLRGPQSLTPHPNFVSSGQPAKEFTWFSLSGATPLTSMPAPRAASCGRRGWARRSWY